MWMRSAQSKPTLPRSAQSKPTLNTMFYRLDFRAIVGVEIMPPTQGKRKEEDFKGRKITIHCVDKN